MKPRRFLWDSGFEKDRFLNWLEDSVKKIRMSLRDTL
jgi:hypothetical protein